MPFHVVNERPRTPIWDAIVLLLTGVIIILGSDSETTSLTDENGVDLDAFGGDSIARLQAGRSLANKFVSVKGFDNHTRDCARTPPPFRPKEPPRGERRPRPHGVLRSELYMRSSPRTFSRTAPPDRRSGENWPGLTLKEYLCQFAPAAIREKFAAQADYVSANQGRQMLHLMNSAVAKEIIGSVVANPSGGVKTFPSISKNYIHTTRGLRGGRLQYSLKQGLSQMMLMSETAVGETHVIKVKDLGSHANTITLKGYRDKPFTLYVHNKLGAGRDYLRMTIDNVPLTAGSDLQINIKPGIGGVELVAAGQPINSVVSFEYLRGRTSLVSKFQLNGKDGLRFAPSTFITSNQLKVSRINTLFGESLGGTLVKAM
jgi:hypothetical protein